MKAAFSAHQFNKDQLKPLNDTIIVSDMVFDERITRGGIVLLNDNGTGHGIRPRWGQVYAIGPEHSFRTRRPRGRRCNVFVCLKTLGENRRTTEGKETEGLPFRRGRSR